VRQDYRWVPSILFRHERAEILASFLARPHICSTEPFRERLEAPARRNPTAAIAELRRRAAHRHGNNASKPLV